MTRPKPLPSTPRIPLIIFQLHTQFKVISSPCNLLSSDTKHHHIPMRRAVIISFTDAITSNITGGDGGCAGGGSGGCEDGGVAIIDDSMPEGLCFSLNKTTYRRTCQSKSQIYAKHTSSLDGSHSRA